jgi:hypothetical protein
MIVYVVRFTRVRYIRKNIRFAFSNIQFVINNFETKQNRSRINSHFVNVARKYYQPFRYESNTHVAVLSNIERFRF